MRQHAFGNDDTDAIDPHGEIVARMRRQVEELLIGNVAPRAPQYRDGGWGVRRWHMSDRELRALLTQAMAAAAEAPR